MIPVVDLTRIVGWIKTASADLLKWLAFRGFILAVISTLVPLAIYNGWLLIQEQLMGFIQSQMGSGSFWSGTVVEFSGFAGWLAEKFKLQACFMVFSSALVFRFVISFFKR